MNKPLRIIYAGTPDFSVAALQALIDSEHEVVAVYTQPDRPAGRGRGLQSSPVKEKAQEHSLRVYQPETFKDENAVQELAALNADLMIVTAYGLLLPSAVLGLPRLGCINIHASMLPRWRGAAPIQRAILAGDKKTGITIMQMDEGLDTGDMLAQTKCEIGVEDTGSILHDKLMALGAESLMSALPAISEQTCQPVKQDDADACYASKLNKAEAKIDWQQSAEEIQRAIRAYNSWPVAYCGYEKNNKPAKLRLWQADVVTKTSDYRVNANDAESVPGTVLAEYNHGDGRDGDDIGIDVLTGDGILRITQLQVEGKRKMLAADFLNANSLLGQQLT